MRSLGFLQILVWLACAACGSKSGAALPARVEAVPAPAASPPPAVPAEPAPEVPARTPAEPSAPPKAAASSQRREPEQAAKPADPTRARPRPARTQSSIETEKLNRANAEAAARSSVPAEPIAQAPEAAPEPEPAPAPPAPAAKPTGGRVVVPSTSRMRVEVPAGLQRWLDADTRMQPWLNKVMPVIDRCYGNVLDSDPNAKGTITFRVTMHANARPDPDIQSLPRELSGIVTCATGQLFRTKMPLFTGTEGESYTVKVRFGDEG